MPFEKPSQLQEALKRLDLEICRCPSCFKARQVNSPVTGQPKLTSNKRKRQFPKVWLAVKSLLFMGFVCLFGGVAVTFFLMFCFNSACGNMKPTPNSVHVGSLQGPD